MNQLKKRGSTQKENDKFYAMQCGLIPNRLKHGKVEKVIYLLQKWKEGDETNQNDALCSQS